MGRLSQLEGWALMWSDIADRGDFRLRIDPRAFDDSINAGDIQGLLDHNWGQPISRQKNQSMTLTNRNGGLYVTYKPNASTAGKDAVELVQSGDVRGQSVGFSVDEIGIEDIGNKSDKPTVVVKKARLQEVSIVTNPAMKSSSIRVSVSQPSKELSELRQIISKRH